MKIKVTSISVKAPGAPEQTRDAPDPLHLTDRDTFVRTVIDDLPNHPTLRSAFEFWNDYFERHAERPRYASFESFRVTKHRYHADQKENRQLSLF